MTAAAVTASTTSAPAADMSPLSASVAETDPVHDDEQQLDTAESSQTADDDIQPLQLDSPVADDNSKDTVAASAVSHEAEVDTVDDGGHGDEEQQQPPQPALTSDTPPPIPTDDKPLDSDNVDDSTPADETDDAGVVLTAVDDDDVADESMQPSSTQAKPELKYQYSEGQYDSVISTYTNSVYYQSFFIAAMHCLTG